MIDQILSVESGGNPTARNPRSSAYGAGQFLDATWLDVIARHRPDLTAGRGRAEVLGMRADPDLSRAMTEAYANDNAGVLRGAGLPVTAGTTYLAHFAGPQGAVNVLKADPAAPVGSILGAGVVKANPFLARMTVADLRSWADRKMGSGGQQPAQGGPYNTGGMVADSFAGAATPMQFPSVPTMQHPFGMLAPEEPPPRRRTKLDPRQLMAAMQARPQRRAF